MISYAYHPTGYMSLQGYALHPDKGWGYALHPSKREKRIFHFSLNSFLSYL
jgi:hypothetical protein